MSDAAGKHVDGTKALGISKALNNGNSLPLGPRIAAVKLTVETRS